MSLCTSTWCPRGWRRALGVRATSCLRFPLLFKTPWPTATWGEKGLFNFTAWSSLSKEVRAGTQSGNLEAGIKAGPWRGAAYSFAQSVFS